MGTWFFAISGLQIKREKSVTVKDYKLIFSGWQKHKIILNNYYLIKRLNRLNNH